MAEARDQGEPGSESGSEVRVESDTEIRVESDSLGEVRVPAARYWGAQTERSRENFPIGDQRFPRVFLRAYGLLKGAAARANAALGEIDPDLAEWIAQASDELARGDLDDDLPLRIWQSGSGTQTHMNVNEVLAGRANELAGGPRGGRAPVHPNDHVNRGQSTNDTFPTAMHVASALALRERLEPALDGLLATLDERARRFADVVKLGRTHLQDATPLTLGQEIGAWASAVRLARAAIEAGRPRLHALALGGTAVGTGLNAHPRFAEEAVRRLADATGVDFVPATDRFAALAGHEPLVELSGGLANLATSLLKMANDVRWLASGPRGGLGEIAIPANEPGSSIMPGKVNPTQAEALAMVCSRVIGNHATVVAAAGQGNLQLNVQKPVTIHALLESIELLADAVASFDERCLRDLEPRRERIAEHLERSLMLVTALAPHVGYDAAAAIAEEAHARGVTLREAALDSGRVSAEQFDAWVRPERMVGRDGDEG
jgi:fumarate hydratase class II